MLFKSLEFDRLINWLDIQNHFVFEHWLIKLKALSIEKTKYSKRMA